MAATILLVDDDPVQRRLLEVAVARFGHRSVVTDGGAAALDILDGPAGAGIGAVVLDLVMPGLDGLGVLAAMRERGLAQPVVVQTAQGGIETVVSAMRAGAFDFVVKPVSPDRLQAALGKALKVGAAADEVRRTRRRGDSLALRDLATRSAAMERAIRLAEKAAATAIPVLIEGESGTGKEVLARAIHAAGDRRGRPLVTVNCGAIPDALVESILFGHEKGSFTGAAEKHAGKFAEADGGTLFLDEIGDLPPSVQVKLLRAVQDGEVDPVGGRLPVKVDVRLISATHRNLLERVREGAFREDLFYRLNVFPVALPPLRERRDDIPQLVRRFMARSGAAKGVPRVNAIAPEALALLSRYDWPGNIRQLENAVLRACVLADGDVLTVEEFPHIRAQVEGTIDLEMPAARPKPVATPAAATSAGNDARPRPDPVAIKPFGILRALDERGQVRSLAEVEAEMIRLAIAHYRGQMSEVARRLGIGRSTLYRKLREYGIDPEGDRLAS